jgi:hypothetical protein
LWGFYNFILMLKKIILLAFITIFLNNLHAQVLYSERFNAVSGLNTGTYTANSSLQSYLYGSVPSAMTSINNGNLYADTTTGNYPYKAQFQSQKGWLAYRPAGITNITDTFAVSTSWLIPTGTSGSWLITPTISNIASNSVLTWEAMAPDANNLDGYDVYVSTNTVTAPSVGDFTTLVYTTAAENNIWQTRSISLGAFAGQNIRIAFKNNSIDKYQLWLDDIVVKNIPNAYDVIGKSNDTYKYSVINTNNSIIATFQNNGYTPISSVTLNYKAGNNAVVSETQNLSTALNYLGIQQFTISAPLIATLPSYNDLKVWVSNINGQADQFNSNDTVVGSITISSSIPDKKIVVEEFTGATYGWCPDGQTKLFAIDTALATSNVIVASIHDHDNMSVATGTTLSAANSNGFPSAMIDRHYFPSYGKLALDRLNWNTYLTQRQSMVVPATVTITAVSYNSITRQISATVSSTFVGDVKGDYRLNLYVKENNVYGPINDMTDNNWNQHSYLYTINSSPYYQVGSVLNASSNPATYLMTANDYKHQYVVDEIIDGTIGAGGIIPTNGTTTGQTYSKTYTYTMPTATSGEFRYNEYNVYLIGTLSENNVDSKAILNAVEVKLTSDPESTVGVANLTKSDVQLNLFPNPTSDVCTLTYSLQERQNVKVSVFNTLGELVYLESLNASVGINNQSLGIGSLSQGNYTVKIDLKNGTVTKKLTIIK